MAAVAARGRHRTGATGATDTTDTTDVGISTVEVGAGIAADDRSGTSAGPSADTASVDTASVVNALVDTPDARSVGGDDAPWVAPLEDGSCPDGYPIKANDNSGIFHVPGGRFYDRTKPERCYADAESAVADGYRQAKQ